VNLVVRDDRLLAPPSLSRQDNPPKERGRTDDDDGLYRDSRIARDHPENEADGKNRPFDSSSPPTARFLETIIRRL
jgi:hypothetical protein